MTTNYDENNDIVKFLIWFIQSDVCRNIVTVGDSYKNGRITSQPYISKKDLYNEYEKWNTNINKNGKKAHINVFCDQIENVQQNDHTEYFPLAPVGSGKNPRVGAFFYCGNPERLKKITQCSTVYILEAALLQKFLESYHIYKKLDFGIDNDTTLQEENTNAPVHVDQVQDDQLQEENTNAPVQVDQVQEVVEQASKERKNDKREKKYKKKNKRMKKKIKDLKKQYKKQKFQLNNKKEKIKDLNEQLKHKDNQLNNQQEQLKHKDFQLNDKQKQIKDLNEQLKHKERFQYKNTNFSSYQHPLASNQSSTVLPQTIYAHNSYTNKSPQSSQFQMHSLSQPLYQNNVITQKFQPR